MAATFCCCNCPVGPAAASNTTTTAFLLGENISTTLLPVHSTLSLSLFILPCHWLQQQQHLNSTNVTRKKEKNQPLICEKWGFWRRRSDFFPMCFPCLKLCHTTATKAPAWPPQQQSHSHSRGPSLAHTTMYYVIFIMFTMYQAVKILWEEQDLLIWYCLINQQHQLQTIAKWIEHDLPA